MMRKYIFLSIVLIIFGFFPSFTTAYTRYIVTDLGTNNGKYEKVFATSINENGQVIGGGWWHDVTGVQRLSAWVWDDTNGMQELEDLDGMSTSAQDIGDSGQVVGRTMDSSDGDRTHGVVWENGSILYDLGRASAGGINIFGQVVGTYPGGSFLWDSTGGMQNLFQVGIDASRINDSGQVTGTDQISGEYWKPFIWDSTKGLQYLIIPSGYRGGIPSGINNLGQVVGNAWTDTNPYPHHAFLWNDVNDFQILGTLGGSHSYAIGINDSGVVVGESSVIGSSYGRSFIWDDVNGMQDLNDLFIPGHCFEFISAASDINNTGQIVGRGHIDSSADIYHAVLLTPVPEPVPHIFVSPLSHNFGSLILDNSSDPLTVTIYNYGEISLHVSEIVLLDDTNFSFIGNTTATIEPSGSQAVILSFNPRSIGQFSSTLRIVSDDPYNPTETVELVGEGSPILWGCIYFQGSPLANVEVKLNQGGKRTENTITDFEGCYRFERVNVDKNFKIQVKPAKE